MAATTEQQRTLRELAEQTGTDLSAHPLARQVIGGYSFNRRDADRVIAELRDQLTQADDTEPTPAPEPTATPKQVAFLADLYRRFAVEPTQSQLDQWASLTRRQASQLIDEYRVTAG